MDRAFLESIVRSLPDPVMVLDEDGRYVAIFGGEERSRYDSMASLVGRTLHDVLPPDRADGFLAEVRDVIETGRIRFHEYALDAVEVKGNPQDGPSGTQWFQGRIAPIDRPGPGDRRCVAWVIVNISERRRLEAELDRLAHRDELTGLANRRSFLRVVEAAMRGDLEAGRDHALHVAMVDLDHFKAINDAYGHLVGDAVLQHFGRALSEHLCAGTTVGRVGGEEFAALFRGMSLDEAVQALQRAQQDLRDQPLGIGTERIAVRFSAGVTAMVAGDRSPGDLIRRADHFLYEAKAAGRDRIAFPGWFERRQR